MNTIRTTLTTSGNSVAVRLPKNLLHMSGLGKNVQLEAKRGKIVISNVSTSREGWNDQIKELIAANGDPTKELEYMQMSDHGLEDLAWNGSSFEEWQKEHARLS